MKSNLSEVVDRDTIARRVEEIAAELTTDYASREPVFVGVLTGSVPFLADLVRACDLALDVDFLAVSRFGEGGRVSIAMDTDTNLADRHVVIVEDIVDTGLTLSFLRELLEARNVASLATVTLIDKAARRIVDVPLEYRGFESGDEFLLGYGLDWEGRYRNLPSLWAVLDLSLLTEDGFAFAEAAFG